MRICVFALLMKAAGPVPSLLLSHLPLTCTSEPDHILICALPQCPVEWVDAEHPLFLLYTSGSTGKPKGVVHATGEHNACLEAFRQSASACSEMRGRGQSACSAFWGAAMRVLWLTLKQSVCFG